MCWCICYVFGFELVDYLVLLCDCLMFVWVLCCCLWAVLLCCLLLVIYVWVFVFGNSVDLS